MLVADGSHLAAGIRVWAEWSSTTWAADPRFFTESWTYETKTGYNLYENMTSKGLNET